MPVLLIAGLAALLLGIILFFVWFGFILGLIKAVLPAVLMAGGAVAAYLGWEEMRDRRAPAMDFSNPDEASRYHAEAEAYQARINAIKNGKPVVLKVGEVEAAVEIKAEAAVEEAVEAGVGAENAVSKAENETSDK